MCIAIHQVLNLLAPDCLNLLLAIANLTLLARVGLLMPDHWRFFKAQVLGTYLGLEQA